MRAKVEFAKIQLDRWKGEYHDDHRRKPTVTSTPLATTPTSLSFTEVLEKYLAGIPRPARTANPLKAEFLRFIETIGGDKPIATITRADAVAYKESLQLVRKLTATTCIKHISNTDTFFKWAMVHDYLPEGNSPFKGLAPSKRQAKKQALKRRPFTDEELLTMFGSKEFLNQRRERPERYWLVLFLLFQVCRHEEAGQLYLKDIGEAEGIPYINITDDEPDQSLKNQGSKRRIPVHSSLLRLGLVKYVEGIRRGGHKRLFPQLDRKGNNGYCWQMVWPSRHVPGTD